MSVHLVGACACGRLPMADAAGEPMLTEDGTLHHPIRCIEPAELVIFLRGEVEAARKRVAELELGHSTIARHRDLVCNAARAVLDALRESRDGQDVTELYEALFKAVQGTELLEEGRVVH